MMTPTVQKELTKNQALVWNTLDRADGPLTAYTILEQLRDEGFRAPPQVYRALDKLIEFGLVHRLESLKAFVACRHPSCRDHDFIAFMICEACDQVAEISDPSLTDMIQNVAADADFKMRQATIELKGQCAACAAQRNEPQVHRRQQ